MFFDSSDKTLRDKTIRKGAFREVARFIVSKDREYRKHGASVDTGGTIARALENAYKLGKEHGANETPHSEIKASLDAALPSWSSIPKRARDAFSMICEFNWIVLLHKNAAPWKANPDRWNCYRDRGEEIEGRERYSFECSYSLSTLSALTKLGLMSVSSPIEKLTMLEITDKGWMTYAEAVKQRCE